MKTQKTIAILLLIVFFVMQFNFITCLIPVVRAVEDELVNFSENDEHYNYFYEQLSNEAKRIYDAMREMYITGQLKTGNTNYDLISNGKVTKEQVEAYKKGNNELIIAFENARDAFYLDYPEIFYINIEKYSIRITYDNNGYHVWLGTGNNSNYYLTGFSNEEAVNSAEEEYLSVLSTIVNGAKALESQYNNEELLVKQIEYVHDEVIKSATYKLDDVCKITNRGHIRTPYGALVEKEAVCEGYAKSVKVALDKIGIPCILVRGTYKWGNDNLERHMWNYVQVAGKWYAVDSTFDDIDKINQMGQIDSAKDYFLAGESFMSVGHYPEGIMSAPEFEFKYPNLEYNTYGVTEVSNVNGLEVKYSSLPYEGNTVAVLDVSYKGMNFANAKKTGYHFLLKWYSSQNEPDDKWLYIDTTLYPSMIVDGSESFSIVSSILPYVEIAVTDIPIDERAYSQNPSESSYYQKFVGDESMFLAHSGIIELPDATYVAPPRFISASPYVDSKLKAGQTTHIKITYDQELVKISENINPDCYISTKNAWTTSATTNSTISNFDWDGNRTIQFDFIPSSQYGDNSVIYYFNITGLVGKESNKVPTPAYYYVQNTFGCTYSMAQAKAWRVYGRPTLIDDGTTSVEGWNLSDGTTISSSQATQLNEITDRLALVVDKTTLEQDEKMNSLIEEQTTSKILSSETYNINLIVCNKKVLSTANGHKVTVYLGFPEGYGPDDAGVIFKAYHFKTKSGEITEVEEIPCVITPYGLLVTCDAFSPFEVVAMEAGAENLENKEKSVVLTSDGNGVIEGLQNSIITLNLGESKTYKIRANNEYQIETLTVLGKEIIEAKGQNEFEITVNYDDLVNGNNIVDVTFIAEIVAQAEEKRGEAVVNQGIEPATIENMPEQVLANIGKEIIIAPEIISSNGIDTYQWYKDDLELLGETNGVLKINQVKVEDEGIYKLVVTSTLGTLSEQVESAECKVITSSFEMSLEAEKKEVLPGEVFEVNAYLKNIRNIQEGIIAFTGQIEFDTSILEIYKGDDEQVLNGKDGWNLSAFNNDNFKFVADNSKHITENSNVFTVYLKVKDSVTTEQNVTIALKNISASGGNGVLLPVSNAQETVHISIEEEEDYFTSNVYIIDDEAKIISKIMPETTVADFISNVDTNQTMVFTDREGNLLSNTDLVTTASTIKVGEDLEYTLSVLGDVDGDGKITLIDLAVEKLYLIDLKELSGVYLVSADLDMDKTITINDIAQIKLVLIK